MFKKPTIEDKKLLKKYYDANLRRGYECSFGNACLWAGLYDLSYDIIEDMLIFRNNANGEISFCFPIGQGDVKKVIDNLLLLCEKENIPFQMYGVTKDDFALLDTLYPNKFNHTLSRDSFDYIYLSERLATLKGKKLSAKRNHINRFAENNPDWSYEAITKDNIAECEAMLLKWASLKDGPARADEVSVAKKALKHFFEFEFTGGLIRAKGEVIAFTMGERLCDDTFIVHFEKAFADIQGAYQIINREFVRALNGKYKYINREEDTGNENLRKAKLSYHPDILLEKGHITLK